MEEESNTTLDALALEEDDESIPEHITLEELVREQAKDFFCYEVWEQMDKEGEKVRFRGNTSTGIFERIIPGNTGDFSAVISETLKQRILRLIQYPPIPVEKCIKHS